MRRNRELLDVSQTNMSLRGSDLEKNVMKAAAEKEEAWGGDVGKVAGLFIWRIENFQVVEWSKSAYGRFYDGDSYIILHSREGPSGKLAHDIHFWIGKYSTQDEYGTAAYKTVELDNYLDGAAIQHRQVDGHESPSFLSLFPEGLFLLEGGAASGFTHVEAGSGNPPPPVRLFHVKGTSIRNTRVRQVVPSVGALNEGDAFVLDATNKVFVFQGTSCSPGERMTAMQFAASIQAGRVGSGIKMEVVTTDDAPEEFWTTLGGAPGDEVKSAEECALGTAVKKLFRFSDSTGEPVFTEVASGDEVSKSQLDTTDVFVLNNESEIFVWIGKNTTAGERLEAMPRAQEYLNSNPNANKHVSITVMHEGLETPIFHNVIG